MPSAAAGFTNNLYSDDCKSILTFKLHALSYRYIITFYISDVQKNSGWQHFNHYTLSSQSSSYEAPGLQYSNITDSMHWSE